MRINEIVETPPVYEISKKVRNFLEKEWDAWRTARYLPIESVASKNMCRMSSKFLSQILERETGDTWTVVGGAIKDDEPFDTKGSVDGGMQSIDGKWYGHYWVVGPNNIIIDITADQFGYDPIIVSTTADPRYRDTYYKKSVQKHLKFVKKTVSDWDNKFKY